MIIPVDGNLRLELIREDHADMIFKMVDENRSHLQPWLSFVQKMDTVVFARQFVEGTMQRNAQGQEYAFLIMEGDMPAGRIGLYKIDPHNLTGELGYWLIEAAQGRGIVTRSCQALLDFCFRVLHLHRVEIRCGASNQRSMLVPKRLGFTFEGTLREAEWLPDRVIDLHVFSMLKQEYNAMQAGRS
jgi:ribosomal-protein-serine acetyltransferase